MGGKQSEEGVKRTGNIKTNRIYKRQLYEDGLGKEKRYEYQNWKKECRRMKEGIKFVKRARYL